MNWQERIEVVATALDGIGLTSRAREVRSPTDARSAYDTLSTAWDALMDIMQYDCHLMDRGLSFDDHAAVCDVIDLITLAMTEIRPEIVRAA